MALFRAAGCTSIPSVSIGLMWAQREQGYGFSDVGRLVPVPGDAALEVEPYCAHLAGMWLLASVDPLVPGDVALVAERLGTDGAGIRLLTRVGPLVPGCWFFLVFFGGVGLRVELLRAHRAGIWLLAGVGPLVDGDVALLVEALGAYRAGIRLLTRVGPLVPGLTWLKFNATVSPGFGLGSPPWADGAGIRLLLTGVGSLVPGDAVLRVELVGADGAGIPLVPGDVILRVKLFEADGYSFSPVWVRSCLVMLNFVLNVSAQMEQIWGFSSAWVRSCAAAWPFWPNFFTGACKRHFPLLVPAYGTLLATRLQ